MVEKSTFIMEPMMPEEGNKVLEDLTVELIAKASGLASTLRPEVRQGIGTLVRSMNCYYSNLIENHNTHPRDIDRALVSDFSSDPKKRDLQLEAKAHIEVQEMIDNGQIGEDITSPHAICWVHKEFCSRLPEDLLWVENLETGKRIKVIPGMLRDGDVQVGSHIPPLHSALPAFLERFHTAYDPKRLSKMRQVVAIAAAHHRLLWIHPFYDGNGRVTRLLSHAYLKTIGIGNSLWSISRGLARNVHDYKGLLMAADAPRHGDLDGRGNLTEKGLREFCVFFLRTCIDQVDYMANLLEPMELLRRIEIYITEEVHAGRLLKGSFPLLREALIAGEYERSKASTLTGYQERQARTVLTALQENRLLISDSPRGKMRLGFPIDVVERWFPKLYPGI